MREDAIQFSVERSPSSRLTRVVAEFDSEAVATVGRTMYVPSILQSVADLASKTLAQDIVNQLRDEVLQHVTAEKVADLVMRQIATEALDAFRRPR